MKDHAKLQTQRVETRQASMPTSTQNSCSLRKSMARLPSTPSRIHHRRGQSEPQGHPELHEEAFSLLPKHLNKLVIFKN